MREMPAILLDALRGWRDHRASFLAAGLTFYTLVSVPPLVILLLGFAGAIFGPDEVQRRVVGGLASVVGPDAAEAVRGTVGRSGLDPGRWTARAVGLVILFLAASRIFAELELALWRIWGGTPRTTRKDRLLGTVRANLASLVMVAGAVLIWLLGTVSLTWLSAVSAWVHRQFAALWSPGRILQYFLSLLLLTLAYALIYRLVPRGRVAWRAAWLGAVFTALLMSAGQKAIALLLGWTTVRSLYGAAGSLMVLMLWFFYSWMIFLLGAEFTRAIGRRSPV